MRPQLRAAESALYLCLLLTTLVGFPLIAPAEAADVITAVEVTGNRSLDSDSIRSQVPLTKGTTYINHLALDDRPERLRSLFAGNYDRLVAVKNKYDPNNLFRLNANVKPSV